MALIAAIIDEKGGREPGTAAPRAVGVFLHLRLGAAPSLLVDPIAARQAELRHHCLEILRLERGTARYQGGMRRPILAGGLARILRQFGGAPCILVAAERSMAKYITHPRGKTDN